MESNNSSSSSSSPDSDPPSQRNRNGSKKKRKLSRRQSYRLKQKMLKSKIMRQAADRSYLNSICVTRTVEWPSTQKVGEEKTKLLFMLAIGLNPKPGSTQNLPSIKMEKMDSSKELKARAKTKTRLFEIYRKREMDELRQRATQFLINAPARPSPKNSVEVVNLVSDDEDEGDQNNETEAQAQPLVRITRQRSVLVNGSSSTCHLDTDHEDTTSSIQKVNTTGGPRLLQPMLSKKVDKILFRNRKPESFTKLVDGRTANECTLPPLNGAHKKLMATLQKATPASSPLTVRNQASSPIRSIGGNRLTGGVYKTQNSNNGNGVRNGGGGAGASSTSIPDNLIIIDID